MSEDANRKTGSNDPEATKFRNALRTAMRILMKHEKDAPPFGEQCTQAIDHLLKADELVMKQYIP
jgi:hypothetical protein